MTLHEKDMVYIARLENFCFGEDKFGPYHLSYLNFNQKRSILSIIKDATDLRVGYFSLIKFNNNFIIYSLAVDPVVRKMGIATKIMETIEKIVLLKKGVNISLAVNINNKPAILLYEKLGYKKYRTKENYYKDGSSAILMKKELYE